MKILIKEKLSRSGLTFGDIADQIGVTYNALYARTKNPTVKSLREISEAIGCNIHELIEAGEGYAHFYDDQTGEYLGIRKK